MNATIYFFPQVGDTVGDFWAFKTGTPNGGNLRVEYAPLWVALVHTPWFNLGEFSASYERSNGRGRLGLTHTVPELQAIGIDPGIRYDFARVRIKHQRNDLSGCRQPICAEWDYARFTFATGRELEVQGGAGCSVRRNAPAGVDCSRSRATTPQPWRPKIGAGRP